MSAPADEVWALISHFEHWPKWGPTVRAVRSAASRVAPGVEGRVQTPLRVWLPFRITEVEEGVSWRWEVGGIGATGHDVAVLAPGSCRLTFSVPWVAAPYLAVVHIALRRIKRLAEGR